ncbi:hypothetical protein Hanom_Chr16g01521041 [Helianthus anomalus]
MELMGRIKMARFQTFWIQMRKKNKPLDENRKTGQTLGTKMAFYSTPNNKKYLDIYNKNWWKFSGKRTNNREFYKPSNMINFSLR